MTIEVLGAAGEPLARIVVGSGPVICVALHSGHAVRPELVPFMAIVEEERLREEDPHTAAFAPTGAPLVEVVRSRFEVDLNRTRDKCVYLRPEDAWGLSVYREGLAQPLVEASRAVHDIFYARVGRLLDVACEDGQRFVVFDLHSYNHRRSGPSADPDDAGRNPEVNLGTDSIRGSAWGDVIGAFTETFLADGFEVAENVKFGGGAFARWVNARYGDRGCALAIEYKKTFMDEWTGAVDDAAVARLAATTARAAAAVSSLVAAGAGE